MPKEKNEAPNNMAPKISLKKSFILLCIAAIIALALVAIFLWTQKDTKPKNGFNQYIGEVKGVEKGIISLWIKKSQNEIKDDVVVNVITNKETVFYEKSVPKTLKQVGMQNNARGEPISAVIQRMIDSGEISTDENNNLIIKQEYLKKTKKIPLGINNILEGMEVIVVTKNNLKDNLLMAAKIGILK